MTFMAGGLEQDSSAAPLLCTPHAYGREADGERQEVPLGLTLRAPSR